MGIPARQVPEGMQGDACRDKPEEVRGQHLPTISEGFQQRQQHDSFCSAGKQSLVTDGGEWEPEKTKLGSANADIPAQSSGDESHGLSQGLKPSALQPAANLSKLLWKKFVEGINVMMDLGRDEIKAFHVPQIKPHFSVQDHHTIFSKLWRNHAIIEKTWKRMEHKRL